MAIDETFESNEREEKIVFSSKYLPKGKITELLNFKIDEALSHYKKAVDILSHLAEDNSLEFNFKGEDALVKDLYIVGGLLWGRNESDIDLYIQTINTNYQADHTLKLMHFKDYCEGKPKIDWVDVYIGKKLPSQDNFLGKPNYRITSKVRQLLQKHKLLKTKK